MRLTTFYGQFRTIGVNYNQVANQILQKRLVSFSKNYRQRSLKESWGGVVTKKIKNYN